MLKQSIWQWLILALQQHKAVALLQVVSSKGSSPGKEGAKMAIAPDNTCFGTIGGGKVEHDLTQFAVTCLHTECYKPQLVKKNHYPADSDGSGQICGGQQTVAKIIWQLSDLSLLQKIQSADENNQPIILEISPHGLTVSPYIETMKKAYFYYAEPSDWLYKSIIGLTKHAYIIGGGHVSLALTQVLTLLGFEVTVIEQRPALKTLDENRLAKQKLIIPYSGLADAIINGPQAYVFVMTHSHETDQQVVESLAAKDYKYFGVLGSRRKIRIMKKNLTDKINEQKWQSINAPIGLPINSHTPMEIAISIAAELIQFDNA